MRHNEGARRWVVTLVLVAIGAFSLLGVGAAVADTSCNSGRLCLWEDSSYQACKFVRDSQDRTFVDNDPCGFGGDGFNDDTSSGKNRESFTVTLCGDIDFQGGVSWKASAGENQAQVPNNDTASSVRYANINC